MSKRQLWFGYLEAGTKSTAVALDQKLDTGDANTVYLFNLSRNQILEYRREIVEPKLRPIAAEDGDLLQQLKEGYRKARRSFIAPGSHASVVPDAPQTRRSRDTQNPAQTLTGVVATEQGDDNTDVGAPWDDDDD